jgi:predicted metalloprotease
MNVRAGLVSAAVIVNLLWTGLAALPVGAYGEESDPFEYIDFEYGELDAFWGDGFVDAGIEYSSPDLTVVEDTMHTDCGLASPDVGATHYCALDATIYYSLGDLLGDAYVGDFAMTFTLAHEWSHHLQILLYGESMFRDADNRLFFELQADCFAGSYGAYLDLAGLLDAGDTEEVTAILLIIGYHGPATEQSHGTSDERVDAWFEGFDTGTCESYI